MSGSAAVVTIVRDEAVFLPIWLDYYGRFFAPQDIYVLDHDTQDGSTDRNGFVRVPVHHPTVDWAWHRDVLQAKQSELLDRYAVVLVTDVDEIVVPSPEVGDLGSYLACFEHDFATCRGYEVIHLRDREPPLDLSRPVLEQRGWWFYSPAYCKPLLARVPMLWHGGLHARVDGAVFDDGVLHLLHLHRMDFDLCLARHRQRVSVPWNPRDWNEGWGYQNRIVDAEEFDRWFYEDTCSSYALVPEPIPEGWRDVV
jgi:Glycosyl transferase family 2